jgi:glutathione synthase/RimK-type ligase-like ATP-grasp enzyme
MTDIHTLHENAEWLPPFRAAFAKLGLKQVEHDLDKGVLDLSTPPAPGVYYNRMSASSLTRGHAHAPAMTAALLDQAVLAGYTVINGPNALRLEMSKAAQYSALRAHGVPTPRTIAAIGSDQIEAAAEAFGQAPFILKPNRGGKGLGVVLIQDMDDLRARLPELQANPNADDVWLVQEYLPSPDGSITRMEFIGGKLHYAVRVNTGGAFELCPAEACAIGDAPPMFEIIEGFESLLLSRLEAFLAANDVQIAGIEFTLDQDGQPVVYDVNTNTNYNPDAEALAGVQSGPDAVAAYLRGLASAEMLTVAA